MPTHAQVEVAQFWGEALLELRRFAPGSPVTIGSGPGADLYACSRQVGERHTLVPVGRVEVLAPEDSLVSTRGCRVPGDGPVRLRPGEPVRIEVGRLTYVVRLAEGERRLGRSRADVQFAKTVVATGLWTLALLAAISLPALGLAGGGGPSRERMSGWVHSIRPINIGCALHPARSAPPPRHSAEIGQAPPSQPASNPVVEGETRGRRQVHRQSAAVEARATLQALQSAQVAVLGAALDSDLQRALDALSEPALLAGEEHGLGLAGTRGIGPAGGGNGLGLGSLGSASGGAGSQVALGGRTGVGRGITPGAVTVIGSPSRDLLVQVIRSHSGEVRACYEQQLRKSPGLAGRLVMRFAIDAQGRVQSAGPDRNETGSADLARCVTQRLLSWRFPAAGPGGETEITFPWVFTPAA